MTTYRNTNPEGDLLEKVKRYISGLGLYAKPAAGIPASDLAKWVLPSAVTDYSVGGLGYTKNLGTVTEVKMNNATVPQRITAVNAMKRAITAILETGLESSSNAGEVEGIGIYNECFYVSRRSSSTGNKLMKIDV